MSTIDVYLEIGSKKTFASASDWPGWCRSGRDEHSALQTLFDCGPRYARVVQGLGFKAPAGIGDLRVVERLPGNKTTDFGAPDAIAAAEQQAPDEAEMTRLSNVLRACWLAFDAASQVAAGKELARGPRGGGRDLEGVTRHVMNSTASYLSMVGGKIKLDETAELSAEWARTNQAVLDALAHAVQHGIPEHGPRGGRTWPARYYVRRLAWHVLDHVWEIEDRVILK